MSQGSFSWSAELPCSWIRHFPNHSALFSNWRFVKPCLRRQIVSRSWFKCSKFQWDPSNRWRIWESWIFPFPIGTFSCKFFWWEVWTYPRRKAPDYKIWSIFSSEISPDSKASCCIWFPAAWWRIRYTHSFIILSHVIIRIALLFVKFYESFKLVPLQSPSSSHRHRHAGGIGFESVLRWQQDHRNRV